VRDFPDSAESSATSGVRKAQAYAVVSQTAMPLDGSTLKQKPARIFADEENREQGEGPGLNQAALLPAELADPVRLGKAHTLVLHFLVFLVREKATP